MSRYCHGRITSIRPGVGGGGELLATFLVLLERQCRAPLLERVALGSLPKITCMQLGSATSSKRLLLVLSFPGPSCPTSIIFLSERVQLSVCLSVCPMDQIQLTATSAKHLSSVSSFRAVISTNYTHPTVIIVFRFLFLAKQEVL